MDYNTLFISDIHLGSRSTQSNKLLNFLNENTFKKIYLVGDIINMNRLRKKFIWRRKHNAVIQLLLSLSKDSEIIYIFGKSDIYLDEFIGQRFGNILIKETDIHYTSNHEECYIIHGHQFDSALISFTKFYKIGKVAYDLTIWLNKLINGFLRLFGNTWSLSLYLKSKNKAAKNFVENFEEMVVLAAIDEFSSNVIAGHIHVPADKIISRVRYLNCGCWTEFTSCVVEDLDGDLKLLKV
jgi:UDP-2,3-diacylglucosamine pyrophosphatase LpxH